MKTSLTDDGRTLIVHAGLGFSRDVITSPDGLRKVIIKGNAKVLPADIVNRICEHLEITPFSKEDNQ